MGLRSLVVKISQSHSGFHIEKRPRKQNIASLHHCHFPLTHWALHAKRLILLVKGIDFLALLLNWP